MDSYTKTIVINSPPGSGGIFCRELIRRNIKAEIVWPRHDLFGFQRDNINICVIRNPYDVLASGIEVGFRDVPKDIRDFYLDDEDLMISDQLPLHLSVYYRFLNLAKKLDYITPVSFKFLTEDPDKFLEYIAAKFDLEFKDDSDRVSAEDIKSHIKNEIKHSTRAPREKTEFRKKIDDIVKNYEPIKHAHQEYLLFKDVLQSTENML
jgi:hypothetical protein